MAPAAVFRLDGSLNVPPITGHWLVFSIFFPSVNLPLFFGELGRSCAETDAAMHSTVQLVMTRANSVLLVMVSPEIGGKNFRPATQTV
jgi:hypothetical protein